jgi:hypothetical protein
MKISPQMLISKQDDDAYRVHYRSYRLALVLLLLPPLMLYEHAPALFDGSITGSDLAALLLGVLLPSIGAYLLVEFASFTFSLHDNRFHWRWRNLLRRKSLEIPLNRVVRVRRESVESGDSSGSGYRYRLVVVLDDNSVIGLTRGYSGFHDRQLDRIVNQVREYLGHVVPMR